MTNFKRITTNPKQLAEFWARSHRDTFWTYSISGLDKLTGMKPGDICVIPYFGGGLTYMYDGTKWVKILYNDSINNSMKNEYTDIECKCCGSHKFKQIDDRTIVCEYCGSTLLINHI